MVLERQVTLITGASRGFGLAAAEELTLRGHPVLATMRNPKRDRDNLADLDPALVEIAQCDVTDPASIAVAVEQGLQRFGRIDALFNNAGYGLYGPVEDLSDDEITRQMDTNFTGQIRMARAVLPTMREQHHGKIINVSSNAGKVVTPLMGLYAASKHAVEAMSESLRYEASRWNVDVTILEPGMFASDWQTTNLDVAAAVREGRSPYQESAERALNQFRQRAATRPARAPSPPPSPTSSNSNRPCPCAGPSVRTQSSRCNSEPASATPNGKPTYAAIPAITEAPSSSAWTTRSPTSRVRHPLSLRERACPREGGE